MNVVPLTTASTEFYVPSFDTFDAVDDRRRSGFLVVSAYDDTCVKAYYKNDTGKYTVVDQCVRALEVIQAYAYQGDFTGVYINSTRPISVIGGHECANIPVWVWYCDLIMESAIPLSEWGTEFIVGPIRGRINDAVGYMMRVVAGYDGTEVRIMGGGADLPYSIDPGNYVTITMSDARHIMTVTCSRPCMVIQYNKGKEALSLDDIQTDPFMTTITPNDHFTNNMSFATILDVDKFGNISAFNSFLTVVVPNHAKNGVLLNSQPLHQVTQEAWNVGIMDQYSVISFPIEHNNYSLYHPNPNVSFMGYVYGHSMINNSRTGYGFATGYKSKTLSVVSSGIYLPLWGIGALADWQHYGTNSLCYRLYTLCDNIKEL